MTVRLEANYRAEHNVVRERLAIFLELIGYPAESLSNLYGTSRLQYQFQGLAERVSIVVSPHEDPSHRWDTWEGYEAFCCLILPLYNPHIPNLVPRELVTNVIIFSLLSDWDVLVHECMQTLAMTFAVADPMQMTETSVTSNQHEANKDEQEAADTASRPGRRSIEDDDPDEFYYRLSMAKRAIEIRSQTHNKWAKIARDIKWKYGADEAGTTALSRARRDYGNATPLQLQELARREALSASPRTTKTTKTT